MSKTKAEYTTEGNTLQNNSNSEKSFNSPSRNSDNVVFDTSICLYNKGLSAELATAQRSPNRSPITLNEKGQIKSEFPQNITYTSNQNDEICAGGPIYHKSVKTQTQKKSYSTSTRNNADLYMNTENVKAFSKLGYCNSKMSNFSNLYPLRKSQAKWNENK